MTQPVTIGDATRIYALCEFPSQAPRYVGKTIQPLRLRLAEHLRTSRRNARLPVHRWLAKRARENRQVCIKWLETVDSGCDWAAAERKWIEYMRKNVEYILNLTDGGEGLAGHKFSEIHRRRISKALCTRQPFNCETCGTVFLRRQSEISKGHCLFCSRECYIQSIRGKPRQVSRLCVERGVAAAAQARRTQTHCKRGHALSGDNVFRTSAGGRGCRECRKIHKRTYTEKTHG